MNLKNCPECGKIFVKVVRNLCPDCIDKEEKQFEEVRLYVKENPGHTMEEISEATDVPVEKVLKFVQDGLLVSSGITGVAGLSCSHCGKPIESGKLCQDCTEELRRGMQQAASGLRPLDRNKETTVKNRMYTSIGREED